MKIIKYATLVTLAVAWCRARRGRTVSLLSS